MMMIFDTSKIIHPAIRDGSRGMEKDKSLLVFMRR